MPLPRSISIVPVVAEVAAMSARLSLPAAVVIARLRLAVTAPLRVRLSAPLAEVITTSRRAVILSASDRMKSAPPEDRICTSVPALTIPLATVIVCSSPDGAAPRSTRTLPTMALIPPRTIKTSLPKPV